MIDQDNERIIFERDVFEILMLKDGLEHLIEMTTSRMTEYLNAMIQGCIHTECFEYWLDTIEPHIRARFKNDPYYLFRKIPSRFVAPAWSDHRRVIRKFTMRLSQLKYDLKNIEFAIRVRKLDEII
jgi:hypothetical protein